MAGASIVELVVALALLGVGLTSIGATTVAAARLVRGSLAEREVAHDAWAVIDSVLAAHDPRSGQRRLDGGLLTWTAVAVDGGTEVTARSTRETRRGPVTRRFEAFAMKPPPALPPP